MEHDVICDTFYGLISKSCNRCELVLAIRYCLEWRYSETPDGTKFIDMPCTAEETINDIMRKIYTTRDYKLYKKEKHQLSRNERRYLEEVLSI